MYFRLFAVALLAGIAVPALCQAQGSPVSPILTASDYLAYDDFLFRVNWLEEHAAKLAAQGQDPSSRYARSMIRTQAGLTAREEETVKAAAAAWVQQDRIFHEAARQSAALSNPAGDLNAQRQQALQTQINQIFAALGPARFAVLNTYVHLKPTAAVAGSSKPLVAPAAR